MAGACAKVASDMKFGGGFRRVLWYPPPLTTGQAQISLYAAEKVTIIKIQKASQNLRGYANIQSVSLFSMEI